MSDKDAFTFTEEEIQDFLLKLEEIIGNFKDFLSYCLNKVVKRGIVLLDNYEVDHLCYRCSSASEYVSVRASLSSLKGVSLLQESMIGGRPISTFLLLMPVESCGWRVRCLELASAKQGSNYSSGLEHIEVAIGATRRRDRGSEVDTEYAELMINSRDKLIKFTELYPQIVFDLKAADKKINADVKLSLGEPGESCENEWREASVKFHMCSLEEVCRYEQEHGDIVHVPPNYFDSCK